MSAFHASSTIPALEKTLIAVSFSDISILQKGITDIDKLLRIDFGLATETVMEYISGISSALILMISSLACNCTTEEMQTDAGNACCAAVISIHRRVTEQAVGTRCARNHLTNSTEVLVFCINEVSFYWKYVLVVKIRCSRSCYFLY